MSLCRLPIVQDERRRALPGVLNPPIDVGVVPNGLNLRLQTGRSAFIGMVKSGIGRISVLLNSWGLETLPTPPLADAFLGVYGAT